MVSDFVWGGANAQPVTLSFWAFSSLTGMFSVVNRNAAASRAYPFTYSIPTANTWTRIVVAIPGDTSGTWTLSGNGQGVVVIFDLGSGAVYRGPAGVWAPNGYCGATGTVSVVGTNGATFYVTGVKLEIGSVATPYNRQSLAKSMADCQRYYQFFTNAYCQRIQCFWRTYLWIYRVSGFDARCSYSCIFGCCIWERFKSWIWRRIFYGYL